MDIAELSCILETLQVTSISDEEFEAAAAKVKSLPSLPQEQQLSLYGLYKQGTIGDVNIPQPGMLDFVGKRKWEAWNSFKGFPVINARISYAYIVNNVLTDGTADTNAPHGAEKDGFGAIVSTLNREYDEKLQWSGATEVIFKCVVADDLDGLKTYVSSGESVNIANEEGMTPLHYAADRGYNDIAAYLLEVGKADVNAVDSTGQSALMYAVCCEYKELVETLIKHHADLSLRNADGQTVLEFEDVPEDILEVLCSAT